MNNLSKVAANIAQEIYNIGGDVERYTNQFNNFEINSEEYANKLYVSACKTSYLEKVIETIKEQGYKFTRYEKELQLLSSVVEFIDENFKISNVGNLTLGDLRELTNLAQKYEEFVSIDDMEDELDV